MRKLSTIVFFALALFFALASGQNVLASTLPQSVRVAYNFTRVFNSPNISQNLTEQELQAATIKIVYLNQVFQVEGQEQDFFKITLEHNGQNISGYVYKMAVIDAQNKSPEKFLQTNASVTKNTQVYALENNQYVPVEHILLEKGAKVRLLQQLKASNPYTMISFNHQGQTLTYFAQTKNLKPDGVSRAVLLAITLTIVSITSGSVLLRIFKRKQAS